MKTTRLLIAIVFSLPLSVFAQPAEDPNTGTKSLCHTPPVILRHDLALAGPHDIELQDNLAFVAGKWGSFAIIDVTYPNHPRILSHRTGFNDPETVYPLGNICYMAGGDFIAFDITDPNNPDVLKIITDSRIPSVNGLVRFEHYLIGASKGRHITVFDINAPADPTLADALDTGPDFLYPHDIAIFQNHIAVVNLKPDPTQDNLRIYRIAGSGTANILPCSEWQLQSSLRHPSLIGANRLAHKDNHIYIGCNTRNHAVAAINITDPNNPKIDKVLPTFVNFCSGLAIAGNTLIAGLTNAVEIFDISNPDRFVSIAAQQFPIVFPNGTATQSSGHDLVYHNGILYTTAQFDSNIALIKVNSQLRRLMEP